MPSEPPKILRLKTKSGLASGYGLKSKLYVEFSGYCLVSNFIHLKNNLCSY